MNIILLLYDIKSDTTGATIADTNGITPKTPQNKNSPLKQQNIDEKWNTKD
jgi:hypothetical protein